MSVLLLFSLAFNIFQHINEKNYRERQQKLELLEYNQQYIDRIVDIYDSFVRSEFSDRIPAEANIRTNDSLNAMWKTELEKHRAELTK